MTLVQYVIIIQQFHSVNITAAFTNIYSTIYNSWNELHEHYCSMLSQIYFNVNP